MTAAEEHTARGKLEVTEHDKGCSAGELPTGFLVSVNWSLKKKKQLHHPISTSSNQCSNQGITAQCLPYDFNIMDFSGLLIFKTIYLLGAYFKSKCTEMCYSLFHALQCSTTREWAQILQIIIHLANIF